MLESGNFLDVQLPSRKGLPNRVDSWPGLAATPYVLILGKKSKFQERPFAVCVLSGRNIQCVGHFGAENSVMATLTPEINYGDGRLATSWATFA